MLQFSGCSRSSLYVPQPQSLLIWGVTVRPRLKPWDKEYENVIRGSDRAPSGFPHAGWGKLRPYQRHAVDARSWRRDRWRRSGPAIAASGVRGDRTGLSRIQCGVLSRPAPDARAAYCLRRMYWAYRHQPLLQGGGRLSADRGSAQGGRPEVEYRRRLAYRP